MLEWDATSLLKSVATNAGFFAPSEIPWPGEIEFIYYRPPWQVRPSFLLSFLTMDSQFNKHYNNCLLYRSSSTKEKKEKKEKKRKCESAEKKNKRNEKKSQQRAQLAVGSGMSTPIHKWVFIRVDEQNKGLRGRLKVYANEEI